MSTALAEAFIAAGWREPNDRLLQIALDAWGKCPGESMGGARRDFVVQRLQGEMTFALLTAWQPQAIPQMVGWLLNQARDAIRNERDAVQTAGRGHSSVETHIAAAPAPDAGTSLRGERASEVAKPTASSPSASITTLADKQAARAARSVEVARKLTRLDTVLVYGKPIGDCTVAEVKSWATQRQTEAREAARDARFALALIANLPAGATIRDYWRDGAEVDTIYDRAEAEHAA